MLTKHLSIKSVNQSDARLLVFHNEEFHLTKESPQFHLGTSWKVIAQDDRVVIAEISLPVRVLDEDEASEMPVQPVKVAARDA